ncbi:MAG: preprotein translocase subunit SecE [Hydrotalea sp.]|nr:preprotein translocase subunit SecE [Hydrotalea sp.]
MMKNGLNIATWVRQVIGEVNKVTWPSRQETMMATLMVLLFSVAMSIFLLLADQIISRLIRLVLGS